MKNAHLRHGPTTSFLIFKLISSIEILIPWKPLRFFGPTAELLDFPVMNLDFLDLKF